MVDERLSRNPTASSELAISYKNNNKQSDSTGTGTDQSGHEVRGSEENCEPSDSLGLSGTAREPLKHVPRIYNK